MQAGSSARLQRAGDVRLAIHLLFLEGEQGARVDQKREHRCDSRCGWAADDLQQQLTLFCVVTAYILRTVISGLTLFVFFFFLAIHCQLSLI